MSGVIVHEWIESVGGAEKVLDAMVEQFTDADIYCLWNDAPDRYPGRVVNELPLARSPLRGHKALALPSMLASWRRLPAHEYDWALVSSHAFAHHARFQGQPPEFKKYVYAHTPARYIWTPHLDTRGAHPVARLASAGLKRIDRRRAQEATSIAANSEYVRDRIDESWHRDSTVIYPPVDVERIAAVQDWTAELAAEEEALVASLPADFILGASRFIPYKALDTVVSCGERADIPVVLAGSGPEEERLREIAARCAVPVIFVPRPSDALLFVLFERAKAFVFPPVEDFGIMPVEAMAMGTPVVCSDVGGVVETVVDGVTGIHVADWDSPTLTDDLHAAFDLDPVAAREQAQKFSRAQFARRLAEWVRP